MFRNFGIVANSCSNPYPFPNPLEHHLLFRKSQGHSKFLLSCNQASYTAKLNRFTSLGTLGNVPFQVS